MEFPVKGLSDLDDAAFAQAGTRLLTYTAQRGAGGLEILAAAVLREGESALAEGKTERALALGELAKRLCPHLPTPYFFTSRVIANQDQNKVVLIAQEYLLGWWELLHHFWFLFFAFEFVIFLILSAFLATAATVILFSVVAYCSRWLHEWRERTGGLFREWILFPMVLWLLFLLPVLSQGLFWGLFVCTFLFWSYYSYKERLLVSVLIVVIGLSFLFLPYLVSFRAAKNSLLLTYMVKNQREEGSTYLPDDQQIQKEDPDSWVPYFILASIHASQSDFQQALLLEEEADKKQPASPLILNNLGNIYFYLKQYDKAIESYQAAAQVDPQLALPRYNMSQAYREKLMFEEGEKRYHEAQDVDRKSTDAFTRVTAQNPGRPVVEGHLALKDLWKKAIDSNHGQALAEVIWKALFGPLSLRISPLLAVAWLMGLFFKDSSRVRKRLPTTCQSCGRSICNRCQRQLFDFKVCNPCWSSLKIMRKRTEVSPHIRRGDRNYNAGLLLSFLPGGGHLYLRETFKGIGLVGAFFLLLGYRFFGGIFHPNLMWHLDDQRVIWVTFMVLLLYLISIVDIWRMKALERT